MPSSYSSRLRLEKQATGENTDNWGVLLNTLIDLIDSSIAGMATVAVTGGAYSLTANNSTADESRMAILKFTGVLASNSVITVPTQSKLYKVWNATSGAYTLTLKTAAGAGVAVAQGKKGMLLCDGTDVLEAFDSLAGNLAIVGTLASGATTITGALSVSTTGKVGSTLGVGNATPSASGAGITFPATQSASTDANTLDDYEEGTWTPVDSSGAGLSFTGVTGTYTKIGRQVIAGFGLTYPTTVDATQTLVGGLPFAPVTGNSNRQGLRSYTSEATFAALLVNNAATTMVLATTSGAGITNVTMSTDSVIACAILTT